MPTKTLGVRPTDAASCQCRGIQEKHVDIYENRVREFDTLDPVAEAASSTLPVLARMPDEVQPEGALEHRSSTSEGDFSTATLVSILTGITSVITASGTIATSFLAWRKSGAESIRASLENQRLQNENEKLRRAEQENSRARKKHAAVKRRDSDE